MEQEEKQEESTLRHYVLTCSCQNKCMYQLHVPMFRGHTAVVHDAHLSDSMADKQSNLQ